jgi:hypothetical protein
LPSVARERVRPRFLPLEAAGRYKGCRPLVSLNDPPEVVGQALNRLQSLGAWCNDHRVRHASSADIE